MTTVELAPQARLDIIGITEVLAAAAGATVAFRYSHEFTAAIQQLTQFPRLGASRPKFGAGVRIWTIEPYVLDYDYSAGDDHLRILRIVHGKRNITRKLLPSGPQ